jgi:hypothetical protein
MTATAVDRVVRWGARNGPSAPAPAHQLLVGPDDGYGDVALERLSLVPGPAPWCGPASTEDRLLVVLTGHARVTVDGGVTAVLSPNEVVHLGRGRTFAVEVLGTGAAGLLDLLVLSAPGARPA